MTADIASIPLFLLLLNITNTLVFKAAFSTKAKYWQINDMLHSPLCKANYRYQEKRSVAKTFETKSLGTEQVGVTATKVAQISQVMWAAIRYTVHINLVLVHILFDNITNILAMSETQWLILPEGKQLLFYGNPKKGN